MWLYLTINIADKQLFQLDHDITLWYVSCKLQTLIVLECHGHYQPRITAIQELDAKNEYYITFKGAWSDLSEWKFLFK